MTRQRGAVVPLDAPLPHAIATKRVRRLLAEGCCSWNDPHLRRRLDERKLDTLDVEHLLRTGCVVDHRLSGRWWRYQVEGRLLTGRAAGCVVEMRALTMVVKTAYRRQPRVGRRR